MGESRRRSSSIYNEIVAEELTQKNHKYWSSCVRSYLIAQDLWDVVDGTFATPPKYNVENQLRWRRKNAAALHVILISCGFDAFSNISGISEAKHAWDTLTHFYSDNPPSQPKIEPPIQFSSWQALNKLIYENKWEAAKAILEAHPSALTAKLDALGNTALHVAAQSGHVSMVEEFVRMVPPEHLQIFDNFGLTPLSNAAIAGVDTKVAKCIVTKNKDTLTIPNYNNCLPIEYAFASGHMKMGRYLYSQIPKEIFKPQNGPHGPNLLHFCFMALQLDIASDLLHRCQDLLFTKNDFGTSAIIDIAALPLALLSKSQLVFWKRWIYNYINIESSTTINYVPVDIQQYDGSSRAKGMEEVYQLKSMHAQAAQILRLVCNNMSLKREESDTTTDALFRAACEGNVEFVMQVSKAYPPLVLLGDSVRRWNVFFNAVACRQAEVFNLIHGLHYSKDRQASWKDYSGNTLLHVAAFLAPPAKLNSIAGPALQMQREMQWFKEVESFVFPWIKECQNNDGLKPQELFKQTHNELRKEGEKWMKDTASSCSLVATLVITIMFAAAFTVPGGDDQTSGFPIFLDKQKSLFMIFIIADVISLFSSATSVLMFLGILTSRYKEEDFLKSLPTKLIFGLSTLFLSIVTMVIAFSATILMMLLKTSSLRGYRGYLLVIILASVPVAVFVFLKFRLLIKIIMSTYCPGIFNRKVKPWL